MSEFNWGTEVAEEARPEHQPETPASGPETLAVSADDFSALEERVLRAVNVVKRERAARAEAEERATAAEARATEAETRATEADGRATTAQAKVDEQNPVIDNLQKEVNHLRAERDTVRQRVERLLSQLDALEV